MPPTLVKTVVETRSTEAVDFGWSTERDRSSRGFRIRRALAHGVRLA